MIKNDRWLNQKYHKIESVENHLLAIFLVERINNIDINIYLENISTLDFVSNYVPYTDYVLYYILYC